MMLEDIKKCLNLLNKCNISELETININEERISFSYGTITSEEYTVFRGIYEKEQILLERSSSSITSFIGIDHSIPVTSESYKVIYGDDNYINYVTCKNAERMNQVYNELEEKLFSNVKIKKKIG